jgi:CDP-glycerol glycerophosphotransferase
VLVKVVYNSFMGRFSDNPRAIYERLRERPDLHHTWLVDPAHARAFPDDVSTVTVGSPQERAALESADLVIAGTHTEVDWDKGPDTTYLQTWHGTPLKRIHYDVLLVPPGRLDYLDRDVARWDVLLSPNVESTPRLRQAFGYDGPVWETGYPRNDLLLSPEADRVRAEVRAELGIADDVTAVLYAPTWRDDEYFAETEVPLPLDLVALLERLNASGTRHMMLPRLHYMMTARSRPRPGDGVVDVSYYRDVRELHLAADILVTDYSSLMFDFALTGKPMVFYAYDLERYSSTVRGFYFDLFPEAPGPVVTDPEALAVALLEQEGDRHPRYDEFRATYGHLEDGHATDRVLEQLGLM